MLRWLDELAGGRHPRLVASFKALLAGGRSDREIARAMRVTPRHVELFEKVYFDVRQLLANEHHKMVFLKYLCFETRLSFLTIRDPDPNPELVRPGVVALQTYSAEGHAGWVHLRDIKIRTRSEPQT